MTLLWLILLLLHQAYMLVPVTIVELGDTATMKCSLENDEKNSDELHWYKQTTGNSLKIVAKFLENDKPTLGSEFLASRLNVTYKGRFSNLTIWKTTQEDEGIYHCALINWNKNTWRGTYLLIKGNTVGTSNYTVIQRPAIPDPVHVGDLLTLQCLVLSDADKKTCSGDLKLFWVRAGDKFPHGIIYTDGSGQNKCEETVDSQQRRVFKFSKMVNTSDAGTYYCAVATFGNIIFGNGTKVDVESTSESKLIELAITITCLAISVIINITFICCHNPRSVCKLLKGKEASFSQAKQVTLSQSAVITKEEDNNLNYAALHFSGAKNTRGKAKRTTKNEESVYSQINL